MRIDFRFCWTALLAAVGAAGACARAAARPAAGADRPAPAFRGVYEVGPDRSVFRPCGSGEEWYVAPSSAPAWMELQRRTRTQDEAPRGMQDPASPGAAGGFRRAYVEVQGDTVPLTVGREVGRYTWELRPTRVLAAGPAPRADCP